MRLPLLLVSLLGVSLATCASPTSQPDISPTMLALRVDMHTLARDLTRERFEAARGPSRRIAQLATPRAPDLSPEWPAAFERLRTQARTLDEALSQSDSATARARFSDLIAICTECHERYRPDAGSKIEIEFDP